MKQFAGKVAAITGAGSGMGRALALSLANQGCHLALADVSETTLVETADMIKTPVKVTAHVTDVASRKEVEQFADTAVAEHGCVHMIFNNAGISVTDTVEHYDYDDLERVMQINFWGVVYGTKAFLPYLKQVDEAHIVNTSSIFGTIAVPTQSAYNASKFAVRGFTYALNAELEDTGIHVSCVQPGGIKTNIVRDSKYVPPKNSSPTREEFITRFDDFAGLTANQAAEQILRGVRRNKLQILVGRDARIAAWLERLMPTGYLKLLQNVWVRETGG